MTSIHMLQSGYLFWSYVSFKHLHKLFYFKLTIAQLRRIDNRIFREYLISQFPDVTILRDAINDFRIPMDEIMDFQAIRNFLDSQHAK